jgi:hypothetical protein
VELLFVALAGVVLGLGARYLLPHRHTHGSVLVPALGIIVSCVLWVALTWAGLKWNAGWIWWVTLLGTALIVTVADLVLGRVRTAHDERLLHSLTKSGPVH